MSHPRLWLRAALALLLLGSLAAGPALAQGRTPGGDKDELDKIRQELKRLREAVEERDKTLKDQQKELQALRDRLKALEAARPGGPPFPPFQPPFPPPGGFPVPGGGAKGKILKIDKEDKTKVTVSLKKEDGIKADQMLMVYRAKGPPRPIGRVRVTEVGAKESTGKLEPFPGFPGDNPPEEGDDVLATPGGIIGPGPVPPFPPPIPPGFAPVKGKVSKLDKDKKLVTLTVSGETKGVEEGQTVIAVRTGLQPGYVAMLKITKVNAKQVVAEITGGPPGRETSLFEIDQEVQLMHGPPRPPIQPPGVPPAPPPGAPPQPGKVPPPPG